LPPPNREGYGIPTESLGKLLAAHEEGLGMAFTEGKLSAYREIQDYISLRSITGEPTTDDVYNYIMRKIINQAEIKS